LATRSTGAAPSTPLRPRQRFVQTSLELPNAAGAPLTLQLVVLAPQGYRLRKGSKLLYRQPAFLICTDENLDSPLLIETYLQRWGIEVNFREEKTRLGVGQAQVRCPRAVESAPALSVASDALLRLATRRALGDSRGARRPRPKWIPAASSPRLSTQQAINPWRAEVWGRGLGRENFSGFASTHHPATKPEESSFPLASAVCSANG
jgi:hypothetical protein